MRRYWLPAVLSWDLPEADCQPVRVKLLGEPMVMFRDTQNRIGLLDEFCAHRGTSLWLGRNEQSGLRCVWHGWKYDVSGQCVDQLNERGDTSFAQKIRIKSYPTLELGGVIWAYMGPPREETARSSVWLDSGSRDSPARVEGYTRMQLAAGPRRRPRPIPRRDTAQHVPCGSKQSWIHPHIFQRPGRCSDI